MRKKQSHWTLIKICITTIGITLLSTCANYLTLHQYAIMNSIQYWILPDNCNGQNICWYVELIDSIDSTKLQKYRLKRNDDVFISIKENVYNNNESTTFYISKLNDKKGVYTYFTLKLKEYDSNPSICWYENPMYYSDNTLVVGFVLVYNDQHKDFEKKTWITLKEYL